MATYRLFTTSSASAIYQDTSSYISLADEITTPCGLKLFKFEKNSDWRYGSIIEYLATPGYRFINFNGELLTLDGSTESNLILIFFQIFLQLDHILGRQTQQPG